MRLSRLPAWLLPPSHALQSIDVSHNALVALPPEAFLSPSLRVLRADHCDLALLPATLPAAPRLHTLSLAHNRIAALPPSRIIHDSSIDDMTQFDDGDGDVDMSVWLSVTYAGREQRVYQDGGEFIIGRPDVRQQDLICDLSLKDSRVSRPHARIVHSKGHFYLIDHSRRGSYVEREGGDIEFVHQGMSAALEDEGYLYLADEPSHPETIRIGFALHRSQDRKNGHLRAVS